MREVFDVYNKRPTIYYAFNGISILTIMLLLYGFIYKVKDTAAIYLGIGIVVGIIITFTNLIVTATNLVKMYIKAGDITIDEFTISINTTTIPLADLKKIAIVASDYRGAKASDGSGNRIKFLDAVDKTYSHGFVIISKSQLNNLKQIIQKWQDNGIVLDNWISF